MEGCLYFFVIGKVLITDSQFKKYKEKIKHFKNNFLLDQNQNRAKQNKQKNNSISRQKNTCVKIFVTDLSHV